MDLGIKGRTALVCASSKGLGKACARALVREGVDVVMNGRSEESLGAAVKELAALGSGKVTSIAADVTLAEGRAALMEACPAPDILINNAGGPPVGQFENFEDEDWRRAVEGNMIAPLALIRAYIGGMKERGFGRIVNITSSAVRAPLEGLELSNGARAGLTGAVAILARKASAQNVTINGLLPGPFATDRLQGAMSNMARQAGQEPDEFLQERMAKVPAKRFGDPQEFGAACAFLCSHHAGFITGQNILIDGGGYPGLV